MNKAEFQRAYKIATSDHDLSEIYRTLSSEKHWATKRRAIRWIAARYYAGVETIHDLLARTKTRPCHAYTMTRPELTPVEAREIIQLR